MLALFGFMYYLSQQRQEAVTESQIMQAYSKLSEQAFRFYVETCLDNVLKQGLIILGMQGGYFFENQSGYTYQSSSLMHSGEKISYLIYQDSYPVYYPCISGTAPDFCRYKIGQQAFFGTPQLPSIESIKKELENYIVSEIQKCANLSWITQNYPEFKRYNFSVNESGLNAEVRFLPNTVSVKLDYPIQLQAGDSNYMSEFLYFTAAASVRFEKIYSVVKYIVDNDAIDLYFNASSQNIQQFALSRGYGLISLNKINYAADTIFLITDPQSLQNEGGYLFRFAVKNRPPVLDYISEKGENETIVPFAKDPDEDNITFSIYPVSRQSINVTATDEHRASDSQIVMIKNS
jgi:hypothetical protein